MPIDIRAFWGNNYCQNPPLTTEVLIAAETMLGVHLPLELIALLHVQNGGYTRGFAHPMTQRTTWSLDHIPFDEMGGLVTDPRHETMQNLLLSEYMTREWGLPPQQVLLCGDGHYWVTLDYRLGPAPSVAWIDVECSEDIQIAQSFPAFLEGLVPAAHYDVA